MLNLPGNLLTFGHLPPQSATVKGNVGAIMVPADSVRQWVEHNQAEKRKALSSLATIIMRRARPVVAPSSLLKA
jgi:hypothetical protein